MEIYGGSKNESFPAWCLESDTAEGPLQGNANTFVCGCNVENPCEWRICVMSVTVLKRLSITPYCQEGGSRRTALQEKSSLSKGRALKKINL